MAIIHFLFYDRKYVRNLPASLKSETSVTRKEVFREMMGYAVPYLISAVLTNSSSMIILLMLKTGLLRYGMEEQTIKLYQGIINYEAYKLVSIPQIIATGFSLAIIPHMTEALTKGDDEEVRKLFQKVIETANYLVIPVILFMIFFAREIYFIMYGNGNLDIGTQLLAKSLIIRFLIIFSIIMDSVVIALKMRKLFVAVSVSQIIFVVATLLYWLGHFGIDGYYICMGLRYLITLIISFSYVVKKIQPSLGHIFNNCARAWISVLPMMVIAAILANISFDMTVNTRLITLLYVGMMGLLTVGLYLIISAKLELPQYLFDIEISRDSISDLLTGRRFRQ